MTHHPRKHSRAATWPLSGKGWYCMRAVEAAVADDIDLRDPFKDLTPSKELDCEMHGDPDA